MIRTRYQGGSGNGRARRIRLSAVPIVLLAASAPSPAHSHTPAHSHPRGRGHATVASPATGAARIPAGPRLSISITDGQHTARPGERLSYLIRVQDAGPSRVPDLTVTQTVPSGMRLVSASRGGRAAAGLISWHVGLAGHSAASLRATLRLDRPPTGAQRLAVVACAATQHGKPLVCAAHLDLLPAAAVAAHPASAATQSRQAARGGGTLLGGTAGVLAALAAAGVLVAGGWRFWLRRRLRQAG